MGANDTLSQVLTPEALCELERACLAAVRLHRGRPGYGFVGEEALMEAILSRICLMLKAGALEATADLKAQAPRLALTVYSEALYRGCRSDVAGEQNRAYTELAAYLYRIAYNLVRAAGRPVMWAEDYTQDALQMVWQRIGGCREPGAFLKWSTTILIRIAHRGLRREREHLPIPEED